MRDSPVIGCNSGSVQTSLQTSVSRLAVRSLISLCLIEGKPPLGLERTCSTENLAPVAQTAYVRVPRWSSMNKLACNQTCFDGDDS